jgi:hypothetical protein
MGKIREETYTSRAREENVSEATRLNKDKEKKKVGVGSDHNRFLAGIKTLCYYTPLSSFGLNGLEDLSNLIFILLRPTAALTVSIFRFLKGGIGIGYSKNPKGCL